MLAMSNWAWVGIVAAFYAIGLPILLLVFRGGAAGRKMGDELHEHNRLTAEIDESWKDQKPWGDFDW